MRGTWGDCWFESSLAALANTSKGQQLIADMIVSNPDGHSYTVTFPGNTPQIVTVDDINSDRLKNSSAWANIIEATLIKSDLSDASGGFNPQYALQLLTGETSLNTYDQGVSAQNVTDVESFLAKATHNGYPVVASSKSLPGSQYAGLVVGDHAYTVIGYDPTTQVITLRNPWGANKDRDPSLPAVGQTENGITDIGGGRVTMPLCVFTQYFSNLYYVDLNGNLTQKPSEDTAYPSQGINPNQDMHQSSCDPKGPAACKPVEEYPDLGSSIRQRSL